MSKAKKKLNPFEIASDDGSVVLISDLRVNSGSKERLNVSYWVKVIHQGTMSEQEIRELLSDRLFNGWRSKLWPDDLPLEPSLVCLAPTAPGGSLKADPIQRESTHD